MNISKSVIASVESNPYSVYKSDGYPLKKFNLYERLYEEIDCRLKIPLKSITLGEKIGKGFLFVFFLSSYLFIFR